MNQKLVKKMRKYSKRPWFEYVNAVRQWPFTAKLRFTWHIFFSRKPLGDV